MAYTLDIADLAATLVERVSNSQVKTASAPESSAPRHPLYVALKQAAEALRVAEEPSVSMATVQKIAELSAPGTGSSAPGAAGMITMPKPSLGGLKTTNTGLTAGGGGMGEKSASARSQLSTEFRKIAAELRETSAEHEREELVKAAHVFNAATGLAHLQKAAARERA